jgi:hypothetical protein
VAKVLISIEDGLLRRIDRAARTQGRTRSALIAEMAERTLDRGGPGLRAEARQAMRQLDDLFSHAPAGSAVAELRAEREGRA